MFSNVNILHLLNKEPSLRADLWKYLREGQSAVSNQQANGLRYDKSVKIYLPVYLFSSYRTQFWIMNGTIWDFVDQEFFSFQMYANIQLHFQVSRSYSKLKSIVNN